MDRGFLGRLRQQPEGEVLSPDANWKTPTRYGDQQVGSIGKGYQPSSTSCGLTLMKWLHSFRRARRHAESGWEIQFYLDQETEDNVARGMSPEEARATARKKFGNPVLVQEEIYRMHSAVFFETIGKDLRHALRTMRKNPVFAATAVLTLALGIGANTAIFTVIRAVLLKPLEYRDPDRLVFFSKENSHRGQHDLPFSAVQLDQIQAGARSFAGIGAYLGTKEDMTLSGAGDPEALNGARVSANFLDILGVHPIVGRGFLPEEDVSGGPRVVMISEALWKRRFGGDPMIIGKVAVLESTPHIIVGVLPVGFVFPVTGVDIWVPRPAEWSRFPTRYWRDVGFLTGFARLRPGVTLDQARAEMEVLNQQVTRSTPGSNPDQQMRMVWLKDRLVSNVRPMLWMLFGAVGFVLLIACANVASLMLARATSRSREFAVRASLGATRGALIGQLLTESLALAIAGGALGVLLAKWSLAAIPGVDP
jgi:putative ABC transport system permease protein